MSIYVAKLSKEKLNSTPSNEREFFLIMAHLANEINALNKLLLWSSESQPSNSAEENGKIAMTFMFLRLLAGKLNEGNVLLTKKFYNKISKDYTPALSDKGREALGNIKRYFKGSSNVKLIRNNFAFHYSPEELDAVLPTIPEELEIYISDTGSANILYYFAEVLVNRSILKNMNEIDDFVAYKKLHTELPKVAGWFSVLAESLIVEFMSRYEDGIWDGFADEVHFKELRSIKDIKLPWFTDISEIMENGG